MFGFRPLSMDIKGGHKPEQPPMPDIPPYFGHHPLLRLPPVVRISRAVSIEAHPTRPVVVPNFDGEQFERLPGTAPSNCRPLWLDTTIPSAPASTARIPIPPS